MGSHAEPDGLGLVLGVLVCLVMGWSLGVLGSVLATVLNWVCGWSCLGCAAVLNRAESCCQHGLGCLLGPCCVLGVFTPARQHGLKPWFWGAGRFRGCAGTTSRRASTVYVFPSKPSTGAGV